jgi:hypothetical protein
MDKASSDVPFDSFRRPFLFVFVIRFEFLIPLNTSTYRYSSTLSTAPIEALLNYDVLYNLFARLSEDNSDSS